MKILNTLFLLLSINLVSTKLKADSVDVQVFPNPSSGHFNVGIQSPVYQKAGLTVYNLMGETVYSDSLQLAAGSNRFAINLSNQNMGIYLMRIGVKTGSKTLKLVISQKTLANSLDAVHYNLNLTVRNLSSKTLSGRADITLAVTADSVQSVQLDLLKLIADSVLVDGIPLSFSQTDSTLTAQLASSRLLGDTFILSVYYQGHPVSDASWGGFYFNGDYAYNMGVGFTSKPHNFGRCWFPCFDNFTDRATYSFHVTTDAGFKGVCNGLMLPETLNGDGSTTWNWELTQSIPTYLASVAVGKYEFVKYTFTGLNRTYPVWLAVTAADTAKARASFINLNNALACFESKFGPYPFDRIGYVGVPFNAGAMEHASNIAYPLYAINGTLGYETLFAHELSHMWWGDLATCSTAEDMWLNEGWASFSEAVFLECLYGKEAYTNDIKIKTNDVLLNAPNDDGGWLPVSGIPHNATYGTHVYKKGALMAHSLRTLMGDSAFFAACKQYLQTHQYVDVSSEDLKNTFQAFTSVNLTHFFDKWIYNPGHSDVVLSKYETRKVNGNNHYRLEFKELQRRNNLICDTLPVTLFIYRLNSSTPLVTSLKLINGTGVWEQTLTMGESMVGWSINESKSIHLGSNTEALMIGATGTITLPNELFSINVQALGTGSTANSMIITHHWVGALDYKLKLKGIRISTERYWTIGGSFKEEFKTWGFLNYDGTPSSYLDSELITQTEDSLILLYRPDVNSLWQIHTDNTFQPGASKTDKLGRFWVKDLKLGEYAFGMRDASVTGLADIHPTQSGISVSIHPNPIEGDGFVFQISKPVLIQRIRIVNTAGKQMWQKQINQTAHTGTVPADQLPAGSYILIIETDNGILTGKFTRL